MNTGAAIVADEILAGRGSDILKLWTLNAPTSDPTAISGAESGLLAALQKHVSKPGAGNGGHSVRDSLAEQAELPELPDTYNMRPADHESADGENQPFFLPQTPLPLLARAGQQTPPIPPHPPTQNTDGVLSAPVDFSESDIVSMEEAPELRAQPDDAPPAFPPLTVAQGSGTDGSGESGASSMDHDVIADHVKPVAGDDHG